MKKIIFIFVLLLTVTAKAQNYAALLLPDSLLKHADAVLRIDETKIIIHSLKSATIKHKYAYTILNEAGNKSAAYNQYYDAFNKLNDVSGKLFDAFGKQIKSTKNKDFEDVSYDDNFSLARDGRIKKHNFYYKAYPYTVEYEEEQELDGIYQFPTWQPQDDYNLSVQNSLFVIEAPADYFVRYKVLNGSVEPLVVENGKLKIYTWSTTNIKAIEYEAMQPPIRELTPTVFIGPANFEYAGYQGNFNSWDNYGKFCGVLYKNKDVLPDNLKIEIHKLTDGLQTSNEKINAVYNYLQQTTHYISIQLGIGGLQPFDAKFVSEKKYGDCKALSNYMVSMLKEIGIKSYPAIIYGGKNFPMVYDDFPRHYFNHVVTCVPNDNDTIWLECTSQTESAGYVGSFTGNRKALLITEDGGRLVNTPSYSMEDNLQSRKISATIDEEGNLSAASFTHTTGVQQELQHQLLNNANAEEREKYLNKMLNLPTYKIEKSEYKESKGKIPAMDEMLKITSPGYASITGKRLFIAPNLFNKAQKLPEYKDRHFDVVLKTPYKDVDSIVIKLPVGYSIEAMPKDINIKNKFGTYSVVYKIKDNTIEMIRTREQVEGKFKAAEYNLLYEYYNAMTKADVAKIVMVKNN